MTLEEEYWVGALDAENNDTYVWVPTGDILPESSPVWGTYNSTGNHFPVNRTQGCVALWKAKKYLYDTVCQFSTYYLCEARCPDGFNQTEEGCFFVDSSNRKTRDDAEAACQQYGSHVHLATLDTQQVCTLIPCQNGIRR